jgi:hypothetical protein
MATVFTILLLVIYLYMSDLFMGVQFPCLSMSPKFIPGFRFGIGLQYKLATVLIILPLVGERQMIFFCMSRHIGEVEISINHFYHCISAGWVGITQSVQRWATGRMDGVRFPQGQAISLLHNVQTGSGAHRTSSGYQGSLPGVKRSGREGNHSPQSGAKDKIGGPVPPLPYLS